MNSFVYMGAAFLFAAGAACGMNWLALIPWRRRRGAHWTEQARVLFPVRTGAAATLWVLPAVAAMLMVTLARGPGLWFYAGMGAAAGASVGSVAMDRELFPWITPRILWSWTGVNYMVRTGMWLALIGATLWMPDTPGWRAYATGGGLAAVWLAWELWGSLWLYRWLGLATSAPARLQRVVDETSARMQIPCRETLVMSVPLAQAWAIPITGRLIFTGRLVSLLSDDELAAICAHELAHLSEPWAVRYSRLIRMLPVLPWIFIKPLCHAMDPLLVTSLLTLFSTSIPRAFRTISLKFESRADGMAKVNETNEGAYARALARLYESNLIPAVHEKLMHPSLYDRMLAAGVTPDYPRPKPAYANGWYSILLLFAVGGLFVYFLVIVLGAHR